jgi:hypothetical protein
MGPWVFPCLLLIRLTVAVLMARATRHTVIAAVSETVVALLELGVIVIVITIAIPIAAAESGVAARLRHGEILPRCREHQGHGGRRDHSEPSAFGEKLSSRCRKRIRVRFDLLHGATLSVC